MRIPELKIGDLTAAIPIVQGGMGARVSLSRLASAVANEGGIGTISCVGLGDLEDMANAYEKTSIDALVTEIRKARELTDGLLAVNIMGVLSNADDLVKTAVSEGIKIIVFGAGLPIKLPKLVEDRSVNLVPIVSSARVAELILRAWDKRYQMTADALILEGPLAGGHLGFTEEQLKHSEDYTLEKLLGDVLEAIKVYEDKYGRKIPVITGGGVFDGGDIARMLSLGASGVQMGTRFVCTEECGVSDAFKQAYLDAGEDDIVITTSPVGLPGRVIRNRFIRELEDGGKHKVNCPYRCLSTCKASEARYCIAEALLNSYHGDVDRGMIFCGQNAYRINKITTVKELIDELLQDIAAQ